MKKAGIVLICLQVLGVIGGIANGSLESMLSAGAGGIAQLIGFFLPGIIGVILLVRAKKKAEQ